ncbi:MAG: choice-of-anchor D domain-containing protein [Myxococcales bacterium]
MRHPIAVAALAAFAGCSFQSVGEGTGGSTGGSGSTGAGSTGAGSTGGGSSGGGSSGGGTSGGVSCGSDDCPACPEPPYSCRNDRCVGGSWQCGCGCLDGGPPGCGNLVCPVGCFPSADCASCIPQSPTAGIGTVCATDNDCCTGNCIDGICSQGTVQGGLCVQPTSLDFGGVQALSTATLLLDFEDCGQGPIDLTFEPIVGPNASDFSASGAQSQTLQPWQSVTVMVTFAPVAMGQSVAALPYDSCGGGCPQSVTLSGTGVDGQLACSPSPIDFGGVPSGHTATIEVTCTNSGTEPLAVQSLDTASGGQTFALSGSPSFPLSLAPQQQFTFTVSYAPSGSSAGDQGQLVATWTVADPTMGLRQTTDELSGNP